MTTRDKLLRDWQALEPTRCNAEQGLVLIERHTEPDYKAAWHGIGTPGVVLAATIEGLDEHGWRWILERFADGTSYARVVRPVGPTTTDHHHAALDRDATDALLTAYVKALKAAKASGAAQ